MQTPRENSPSYGKTAELSLKIRIGYNSESGSYIAENFVIKRKNYEENIRFIQYHSALTACCYRKCSSFGHNFG